MPSSAAASSAPVGNPLPGDSGLPAASRGDPADLGVLEYSITPLEGVTPCDYPQEGVTPCDYPQEVLDWLQTRNLDARAMINDGVIDPATGQNVIHLCMSDHKRRPMLSVMRHLCTCPCNAGVWTALSTGKPLDRQPIHILCQNRASNAASIEEDENMLILLLRQRANINAKGTLCVHNKVSATCQ